MLAIMSFQKVRRLRVLKLLWLEDTWIQRHVPPMTSHSTKANNAKKPVRYTSIKKAKPKTISDIAKLIQQRSKETKERQQSVISTSATSTAKPAPPNQMNNQSDARATIISYAKAETSTINLPAQDTSVSAIHSDSEPVQDIVDVEAVANFTDSYKTSVTARETAPHSALIDAAVDFAYSKHVDQMAMEGVRHDMYTDARDSVAKSVGSGVESTSVNAPQEASTQGYVTANISQNSQTSELMSSHHDVVSTSEKYSPEVVVSDETVYMPEVLKTSKVMTPEVLSARENDPQESFAVSEVVAITNASTIINFTQSQSTSQDAPNWSSNIKLTSSQEITHQYCPKGTLDISKAESVSLASGDVPAFPEVCHEKAIPSRDPIPEISSFNSAEDVPVCEAISVSQSEAVKVDGVSGMSAEAQSSINLKDPILAQTDILEEEKPTDSVEKLPEAQLDPIQRLFIDKIREYSTKSQASGGLVDAEYEKALSEEETKLQKLYGRGDLTKFPEFNFSEPLLDESNSK